MRILGHGLAAIEIVSSEGEVFGIRFRSSESSISDLLLNKSQICC